MSSPTHIIIIQVQAFIHDDKPTLGLGKETMVSFGFIELGGNQEETKRKPKGNQKETKQNQKRN